MTESRVYLSLAREAPAHLLQGSALGPAQFSAHAVTAALRSALPVMDEEELEYEALWEAAAGCPGRALVAAVDVSTQAVTWLGDEARPSAVACGVDVGQADLVSWHVALEGDDDEAELSWYDASETGEVARLVALW